MHFSYFERGKSLQCTVVILMLVLLSIIEKFHSIVVTCVGNFFVADICHPRLFLRRLLILPVNHPLSHHCHHHHHCPRPQLQNLHQLLLRLSQYQMMLVRLLILPVNHPLSHRCHHYHHHPQLQKLHQLLPRLSQYQMMSLVGET